MLLDDTTPPTTAAAMPTSLAPAKKVPKNGRPFGVIAKGIRVRAWRAIRLLKDGNPNFTLGDILDLVATGAEKSAASNVLKYLSCLERHGILVRAPKNDFSHKVPGPGMVVWHMERDLGWYAPVWRQSQKVLWDPNAKRVVEMVGRLA